MSDRAISFAVIGGPHDGPTENPTCYARTTQHGKYTRWTKPKLSKRTGLLLPRRLTQWARYQDYVDHVRRAVDGPNRRILFGHFWRILSYGTHTDSKVIVDVIAQFRGRAHSDADHVASTIADALFPQPPRHRPKPSSRRTAYRPEWSYDELAKSPGDKLVLARILDFRDGADFAFVAVNIHGPYPRDAWLEGNPVKSFPRVVVTAPVLETGTDRRLR